MVSPSSPGPSDCLETPTGEVISDPYLYQAVKTSVKGDLLPMLSYIKIRKDVY